MYKLITIALLLSFILSCDPTNESELKYEIVKVTENVVKTTRWGGVTKATIGNATFCYVYVGRGGTAVPCEVYEEAFRLRQQQILDHAFDLIK